MVRGALSATRQTVGSEPRIMALLAWRFLGERSSEHERAGC
jgi:hypothetical protein